MFDFSYWDILSLKTDLNIRLKLMMQLVLIKSNDWLNSIIDKVSLVDTLYFVDVKMMLHVFVIPIVYKQHFQMLKNFFLDEHWAMLRNLFVDYLALLFVEHPETMTFSAIDHFEKKFCFRRSLTTANIDVEFVSNGSFDFLNE